MLTTLRQPHQMGGVGLHGAVYKLNLFRGKESLLQMRLVSIDSTISKLMLLLR